MWCVCVCVYVVWVCTVVRSVQLRRRRKHSPLPILAYIRRQERPATWSKHHLKTCREEETATTRRTRTRRGTATSYTYTHSHAHTHMYALYIAGRGPVHGKLCTPMHAAQPHTPLNVQPALRCALHAGAQGNARNFSVEPRGVVTRTREKGHPDRAGRGRCALHGGAVHARPVADDKLHVPPVAREMSAPRNAWPPRVVQSPRPSLSALLGAAAIPEPLVPTRMANRYVRGSDVGLWLSPLTFTISIFVFVHRH